MEEDNIYLYKSFEEYLEYAPFDKSHPYLEAFEIVWRMARIKVNPKLFEPEIKNETK